jgi:hypothetical protein
MAWDIDGVLLALEELWDGIEAVQEVILGSPESFEQDVSVMIGVGSQEVRDARSSGLKRRKMRFINMVMIKVRGNEYTSERTLATLLNDFQIAFYQNRRLGGLANESSLDTSLADSPEYELIAGQEFRRYPIYVEISQDEVIGLV